jgi:predicted dehydrogenase
MDVLTRLAVPIDLDGNEPLPRARRYAAVKEDERIRAAHLGPPGTGIGAADPAAGVTAAGHQGVFADFLSALDRGERPAIDGRESRKAVAIIRAVYESAAAGGAPVRPG